MINEEKFRQYIENDFKPLLEKYQAKIKNIDINDAYELLRIEKNGCIIKLTKTMLANQNSVEFFLANFNKVRKVLSSFEEITDTFYYDLTYKLEKIFGKGQPLTTSYLYICGELRNKGKTIWSD